VSAPDITHFMADPKLLGPHFNGPSWDRWRAVIRAAFALPLSPSDLALFREVAERDPPQRPVKELICIVGRGGGKDSIASALATYIAVAVDPKRVRPGENPAVVCVATDREQAGIAHGYIRGYFDQIPLLKGLVERGGRSSILKLKNKTRIVIGTNNYRHARGKTICAAIYDESAFWRDENSANPDVEVDTSITPGLMRWPGALKVMISSAYRRQGLLFDRYKQFYGQPDDDVLVVLGTSLQFNPTLDAAAIDRELALDYERAAAEYLCKWRDDIGAFVDRDAVMACVARGVRERPYQPGLAYVAFVDPSGGRGDSTTLAVAHREGEVAVLDMLREVRAPHDPAITTQHLAIEVRRLYRVSAVIGDNYAAEWVASAWTRAGLAYHQSEHPRSDLYKNLLPLINSGNVSLLDHERTINQLCALERRITRTGRDDVTHPDAGHDDLINSAAGALVGATSSAIWRPNPEQMRRIRRMRAGPHADVHGRAQRAGPRGWAGGLGYSGSTSYGDLGMARGFGGHIKKGF
jgi:hypothetical protein